MYLIPVACTIIYIMTEMNELDSIHVSDSNQLKQATHLIQRFIINEQKANENLIYTLNMIIGTIFINLIIIPVIMFISNPINIGVLIIFGFGVALIIMNKIVSFIDKKYDKYWLTIHHETLKKLAQEK